MNERHRVLERLLLSVNGQLLDGIRVVSPFEVFPEALDEAFPAR